jgi:hypothetical protein
VSRSADRGFADEIATLAKAFPSIPGKEFIDYRGADFHGMLALTRQPGGGGRERLFQELIDRTQPSLIQQLQKDAPIDIVAEIERQQVKPQAVQRAHATQALSLSTRHDLMTGAQNVPSLLLTKSGRSSEDLDLLLRGVDAQLPRLRLEELSLLDHMALFYQEGGRFNLESLLDGEDLKRSYDAALMADEAVLNPLRLLTKSPPPPAQAPAATTPTRGPGASESTE